MKQDVEAAYKVGQLGHQALQDPGTRTFLMNFPVQTGPATQYAMRQRSWMQFILGAQLVLMLLQLFYLMNFIGFFWMFLVFVVGAYAYRQDNMNITYISAWGVLCLINGLLDIVAMIIPLVFGLMSLDVLGIIVRICIPLSELLGAAFAWDLYCDFLENKGETPPYVNPFRRFFSTTHPAEDPLGTAKAAVNEGKAAYKQSEHDEGAYFAKPKPDANALVQQQPPEYGAALGQGHAQQQGHQQGPGGAQQININVTMPTAGGAPQEPQHQQSGTVFPGRKKNVCC
jgi:hypothetical protein